MYLSNRQDLKGSISGSLWDLFKAKPDYLFSDDFSLERWLLVFLFSGMVIGGDTFTHLNFRNIYVVEYFIVLMSLSVVIKALGSRRFLFELGALPKVQMVTISMLIALGLLTLLFSFDRGFLAFRQSLITLYAVSTFLYLFLLKGEKKLIEGISVFSIILSIIVGIKITHNFIVGNTYADEAYRVEHIELDVVICSLSLLVLTAFHKKLWPNWKYIVLLVVIVDMLVLILTLKRSVYIGLFFSFILLGYQLKLYQVFTKRSFFIFLPVIFIPLLLIFIPYFGLNSIAEILIKKVSVLQESNAVWRLIAWREALADISSNPFLGNGYGIRILDTSIRGVDTADPHNSFLALTVYNGVLGLTLLLVALFYSFTLALKSARPDPTGDIGMLSAFFSSGLLFMCFYAALNVVLEVQTLALIFWFFASGPILIKTISWTDNFQKSSITVMGNRIRHVFVVIFILLYFISLTLPGRLPTTFDVYKKENGGQLPTISSSKQNIAALYNDSNGFTVRFDSVEGQHFSELKWVMPGVVKGIVDNADQYAMKIRIRKPIGEEITFQIRLFDSSPLIIENITPNSNVITLPLDRLANIDPEQMYEMVLIVFHERVTKEIAFDEIVVEKSDHNELLMIYDPDMDGQYPNVKSTNNKTTRVIFDRGIRITESNKGGKKLAYSGAEGVTTLSWRLPPEYITEHFCQGDYYLIVNTSLQESGAITGQFDGNGVQFALTNLTPQMSNFTVPLESSASGLECNQYIDGISLHLLDTQGFGGFFISSVKIVKLVDFQAFDLLELVNVEKNIIRVPDIYTQTDNIVLAVRKIRAGLEVRSSKSYNGWSTLVFHLGDPYGELLQEYELILKTDKNYKDLGLYFGVSESSERFKNNVFKITEINDSMISLQVDGGRSLEGLCKNGGCSNINISLPFFSHSETFTIEKLLIKKKG